MPNATNTLQATIISADQNGVISITRGLGNPALAGNFGDLTINQQLPIAGDNTIALPMNPVQNIYVKNNAASGSGQTVIVKATPNGGAQAILAKLEPGGVFIWWNIINTDANGGYTSLVLNASAINISVEYFLGN